MKVTIFADIDECLNESDECHENATCMDTVGNYSCQCLSGFSGNGLICSGTTFSCKHPTLIHSKPLFRY